VRRGGSLVTCRAAVPCTYELDPTRARMECYIIAGLSSRTQASGLCRSTGENQRRIRDISRIWLPWRDCSCSELRNITYNYIQDIHSIQSGHEAIGKVARYVGRCYPFKLRTRRTVMHPAILSVLPALSAPSAPSAPPPPFCNLHL
jgi:hypothetical protein